MRSLCKKKKRQDVGAVEVAIHVKKTNKQTNFISVFVLLSMCFQPVTGCIQISFHCFKLTKFPFEIRALELSLKHCGDIKFLLLSH